MSLVSILEAGRRDFLQAVSTAPERQAGTRPAPDAWSVLECIEHVIAVEVRYLSWISGGTTIPPRRDPDKELRLFTIVRNRLSRVETAKVYLPTGRFKALSAAVREFTAVRDRTVSLARDEGERLAVGIEHPYFGSVNAVELIQMIDGHTRRHADQIREMPSKPRINQSAVFKRDAPDLPSEFASTLLDNTEEISVEDSHLHDLGMPELRADSLRLSGCLLEKVVLADARLRSAVWKDVRLVGCDLANLRAQRMVLTRVEFVDCRLTGLSASAIECNDVLVQDCDLRYAQLASATFRASEFQHCDCTEADLQEADLAGCKFQDCNLSRADLHRARLQNADLRTSDLETLQIGLNDVRGAIVDAPQAMVLARLLGLQIR